jgi:hypothetical protein
MPIRVRTVSYDAWSGGSFDADCPSALLSEQWNAQPARSYVFHYVEPPGFSFPTEVVALATPGDLTGIVPGASLYIVGRDTAGAEIWARGGLSYPYLSNGLVDGTVVTVVAGVVTVRRWPKIRTGLPRRVRREQLYAGNDTYIVPTQTEQSQIGNFYQRQVYEDGIETPIVGTDVFASITAPATVPTYSISAPALGCDRAWAVGANISSRIVSRALSDNPSDTSFFGGSGISTPQDYVDNPLNLTNTGLHQSIYTNRTETSYRIDRDDTHWIRCGVIISYKKTNTGHRVGFARDRTWATKDLSTEEALIGPSGTAEIMAQNWRVICTHVEEYAISDCLGWVTEMHFLCAPDLYVSSPDTVAGLTPPDLALDATDSTFGGFRVVWSPYSDYPGAFVPSWRVRLAPVFCAQTTDGTAPATGYVRNGEFRKPTTGCKWSQPEFKHVGPYLPDGRLSDIGIGPPQTGPYPDCGTAYPPDQQAPYPVTTPDPGDPCPGDCLGFEIIDTDCQAACYADLESCCTGLYTTGSNEWYDCVYYGIGCDYGYSDCDDSCTTNECCYFPYLYGPTPEWEPLFTGPAPIPISFYGPSRYGSIAHTIIDPWRRALGTMLYKWFSYDVYSYGQQLAVDPEWSGVPASLISPIGSIVDCVTSLGYPAQYVLQDYSVPRTASPPVICGVFQSALTPADVDNWTTEVRGYVSPILPYIDNALIYTGDPLYHAVVWPWDVRSLSGLGTDADLAWASNPGWIPGDDTAYAKPTATRSAAVTGSCSSAGVITITYGDIRIASPWREFLLTRKRAATPIATLALHFDITIYLENEAVAVTLFQSGSVSRLNGLTLSSHAFFKDMLSNYLDYFDIEPGTDGFSPGSLTIDHAIRHKEASPVTVRVRCVSRLSFRGSLGNKNGAYWDLAPIGGEIGIYTPRSEPWVDEFSLTIPAIP